MNNLNEIRRLSAIMFTDIVGYSAIMNRNESAAIELLENHKKITKPIVEDSIWPSSSSWPPSSRPSKISKASGIITRNADPIKTPAPMAVNCFRRSDDNSKVSGT